MNYKKFNPGDRVIIESKIEDHCPGFDNDWIDEMDEFLGKECVVESQDEMGVILVDCNGWQFPPASLKLIESENSDLPNHNTETLLVIAGLHLLQSKMYNALATGKALKPDEMELVNSLAEFWQNYKHD